MRDLLRRAIKVFVLTAGSLACLGCDGINQQQQRAEQERRDKTVNDLRELGEQMHNDPKNQMPSEPSE